MILLTLGVLLFTLMGFAIFNDLTRYLGRLFNG